MDEKEEKKILTVDILGGKLFPQPMGSVVSPFVSVMVHGAPRDCASQRTTVVKVPIFI